ncbi:leucine--tRNA ligase, cytoplasmic-like [Zophobas morio]|uniref:leucine--tRNA ligase, cytoplasmic-like n=1 Tax=Zophobas morio TaxID=2755281 RepID=UPI00308373AA
MSVSSLEILDPNGRFPRRDILRSLEESAQKKWKENKIFESTLPSASNTSQETFFVTFPYPYMNGRLHLGHAFTLCKADFAAKYERLKGKNVLFPFGLHCTGMPIKTSADKIKLELENYGNPPQFNIDTLDELKISVHDISKKKNKPSKVAAKAGKSKFQWEIMKSLGLSDGEIAAFSDPLHWLYFFSPLAVKDLKKFGLSVDWRRTFITTPANPYYDSFVRWQMITLKERGYILFGKRPTVYSPLDRQPCMDHDRSSGEGVEITEYTCVKLEALKLPAPLSFINGPRVYFIAATLRPETLYGITNCFVHPEIDYGCYEVSKNEVFICTRHCSRNLAHQLETSSGFGKIKELAIISGRELLGLPVKAPLSCYERIYTLPMLTIIGTMGTGIVISVPSDSPDDYINFITLKQKPEWRSKWNIHDSMILPFDPVPIIKTEGLGNLPAVTVCQKYKVGGPNDQAKLAECKKHVYVKGFYEGVLLVGEYSGRPVQEAKPKIKTFLFEHGYAFSYAEPSEPIISRSGDTCVVALVDQWYVDYRNALWTERVLSLLENVRCYESDTLAQFKQQISNLHEWACSRSYGLGTRIPWDEQFLVESLSDSTIYMAYYTIAHLLQGEDNIDGSKPSPIGVRPDQLTKGTWDYIFLEGPLPTDSDIHEEKLRLLRQEFQYWYPVSLRVSGKDLINNHLSFFLFTHEAMWGQKYFPKAIRVNGHLKLNNAKMSKSTGNFLTLEESINSFGSDATRLALADAGDTLDDANINYATMSKLILRLHAFYEYFQELISAKNVDKMRTDEYNYFDKLFDNYMNYHIREADKFCGNMLYHETLKHCLFGYQNSLSLYRELLHDIPFHRALIWKYLESQIVMLSIFCPHLSERCWELLGHPGSVLATTWPASEAVDINLFTATVHLENVANEIRGKLLELQEQKKKHNTKISPKKVTIYVAKEYKNEKKKLLDLMCKLYHEDPEVFNNKKAMLELIRCDSELKPFLPKLMPLVAFTQEEVKKKGPRVLSTEACFDEYEFLNIVKDYLKRTLPLENVEVVALGDPLPGVDKSIIEKCEPMRPVPVFH